MRHFLILALTSTCNRYTQLPHTSRDHLWAKRNHPCSPTRHSSLPGIVGCSDGQPEVLRLRVGDVNSGSSDLCPALAQLWLKPPEEVIELLELWLRSCEQ